MILANMNSQNNKLDNQENRNPFELEFRTQVADRGGQGGVVIADGENVGDHDRCKGAPMMAIRGRQVDVPKGAVVDKVGATGQQQMGVDDDG